MGRAQLGLESCCEYDVASELAEAAEVLPYEEKLYKEKSPIRNVEEGEI